MINTIQITCIRKTNRSDPHERIEGVGGISPDGSSWYLSHDQAIAAIESREPGRWKFWTSGGGKSVWVIIAERSGHKYLKTEPDNVVPDNLLSLPACP
jgi:Protein of unknown function (DUF3892)